MMIFATILIATALTVCTVLIDTFFFNNIRKFRVVKIVDKYYIQAKVTSIVGSSWKFLTHIFPTNFETSIDINNIEEDLKNIFSEKEIFKILEDKIKHREVLKDQNIIISGEEVHILILYMNYKIKQDGA